MLLFFARLLQQNGFDDLMIVEKAVEAAIDTVVDIIHDVIDIVCFCIVNVLLRLDVRDESKRRRDVKSTRLGDDTNVLIREECLQALVNKHCDTIDSLIAITRETSADVQKRHVEPECICLVKEILTDANRLVVNRIITTPTTDMETDAHDVQVQAASDFQQLRSFGDGIASELLPERTLRVFCFTANAKHQTVMRTKVIKINKLIEAFSVVISILKPD